MKLENFKPVVAREVNETRLQINETRCCDHFPVQGTGPGLNKSPRSGRAEPARA